MIVTRFVRVCGARGWLGVLRQVMKATGWTFFLDGRAGVDRYSSSYSHRKWCLRGPQQVGRWSDRGKNWSKTGHSCVARHWKRLKVHQVYMIVSVCSAFWLFLREKSSYPLMNAKSGGKATVCTSGTATGIRLVMCPVFGHFGHFGGQCD